MNWVSDFLPHDLPPEIRKDTRVFFYNYDSYWKRDAIYTRLTSVGNSLLEHIDGQIYQSKDVSLDSVLVPMILLKTHDRSRVDT